MAQSDAILKALTFAVASIGLMPRALAESPYVGQWDLSAKACDEGSEATSVISETAITVGETACPKVKVTQIGRNRWRMVGQCEQEGEPYNGAFEVTVTGGKSTIRSGSDRMSIHLVRCSKPSEVTKVQATEPLGPYLFDALKLDSYRGTFATLLRLIDSPPGWMVNFSKTMNGTTFPSKKLQIDRQSYELFTVCKPHSCPNNEFVVLFGSGGRQGWGMLSDEGRLQWLGRPDEPIRAALRSGSVSNQ